MAADLTNARRKIARAKEDLDTLRNQIAPYLDSGPVEFVPESKANSYDVISYIRAKPNPEWELDLGVIAEGARSTLDLVVYQLVIDSGNDPKKGRPAFPISLQHSDYIHKRGKLTYRDAILASVASRHRKVIDDFQPYQRGRRANDDPLAIVKSVAEGNKHRDVALVLAAVEDVRFRLLFPDGREFAVHIDPRDVPTEITDSESFVGIVNSPPPDAPDQKVEMVVDEINVDVFFRVEDGRFVTLDDMERGIFRVMEVIERFAKLIKP